MSDKGVLYAILAVVLAGFAFFGWYGMKRMERMEMTIERLNREPPAPPAARDNAPPPLPAPAPVIRVPTEMPQIAAPHVDPRQEATMNLSQMASLTPYQFSALHQINDDWTKTLEAAERSGESALPRPLADLARERDGLIERLLSTEQLRLYRAFEATAKPRKRFTAAGGRVYSSPDID